MEMILREHLRKAGRSRSERKTAACRENTRLGGWPKGKPRKKPHATLSDVNEFIDRIGAERVPIKDIIPDMP